MKLINIALTALMIIAGTGCAGNNSFDETSIAVSFGVLSDTHVNGADTDAGKKFKSALEQLREQALIADTDGIDGIFIAGDLTNNAYKSREYYSQVDIFKSLYESVFDPVEVPLVYTPGNHDTYKEWTDSSVIESQNMRIRLGENYFLTDLDPEAGKTIECRHCLVHGLHVLGIEPNGRNPVVYPEASIRWLDSTLNVITSEEPDRYVFILTHPMIYNTVYGSTLGDYWDTEALTEVLDKYPQAVTFSGHLHFPLNDPRSIWQGSFTALGCGCTSYMAIEDGGYEYMAGRTIMKDCREFSQGLLVQFDRKGNMRITRMDFFHHTTIGEPWTVSRPQKDISHLKAYSHESRCKANTAPVLSSLDIESGQDTVTAVFSAGTDDEFVHHYVLTVTNSAGDTVKVKKLLADFYLAPQPEQMKKEWREPFELPAPGEYTLTLQAFDSWGAESKPVSFSFCR